MATTIHKGPLHPMVLWAQRDTLLFVTVSVDDMKIDDLTFDEKSMHIKGSSGSPPHQDYECTLNFFAEIDQSKYRRISSGRHVELVIPKAAKGWWPRLLKDATKVPWIKVDFNKWKDEDDDEPVGGGLGGMGGMGGDGGFDFSNYMSNMGGAGGGPPNMDDFGDDSDNEDMPDLEDEPVDKTHSDDEDANEHIDNSKADGAVTKAKEAHHADAPNVPEINKKADGIESKVESTATSD